MKMQVTQTSGSRLEENREWRLDSKRQGELVVSVVGVWGRVAREETWGLQSYAKEFQTPPPCKGKYHNVKVYLLS